MTPQGSLHNVSRANIVALVNSGLSDHEIAQSFGVTDGMVTAYRKKHHIAARQNGSHSNAGSLAASEMAAERALMRSICTDYGRETELFAGLSFSDHPRAIADEGSRYMPRRSEVRSYTGCSAARCAL
jgi:hypothetical protein